MGENSTIEWCDHTFNPWIGCTKVGPGCDHCYAEALSKARLGVAWGVGAERRRTAPSTWQQPRRWNRKATAEGRRYRVFCASLADVFDNAVDPAWRAELFDLIRETPQLDWLLVTKRIGNADGMVEALGGWPKNGWLGVTIVNQTEADRDVPKLLATTGPRYRFLSMEPLLGPVNLTRISTMMFRRAEYIDPLKGDAFGMFGDPAGCCPKLDWIIIGGESGAGARPMHPDWARALRDQCATADVPFLFKQWGEWAPDPAGDRAIAPDGRHMPNLEPGGSNGNSALRIRRVGKKAAGRLLDGMTHDEVPA